MKREEWTMHMWQIKLGSRPFLHSSFYGGSHCTKEGFSINSPFYSTSGVLALHIKYTDCHLKTVLRVQTAGLTLVGYCALQYTFRVQTFTTYFPLILIISWGFCDPLTCPVAPPWGWHVWFWVKCLNVATFGLLSLHLSEFHVHLTSLSDEKLHLSKDALLASASLALSLHAYVSIQLKAPLCQNTASQSQ